MVTLSASTLTEARRERESLLAGLREGRIASRDGATFCEVFVEYQDARNLSERTRRHEQHLLNRNLVTMKARRVQDVSPFEVARVLRGMRDDYSPWTCTAVYRLMAGTFSLALRRGPAHRSRDSLPQSGRGSETRKRSRFSTRRRWRG